MPLGAQEIAVREINYDARQVATECVLVRPNVSGHVCRACSREAQRWHLRVLLQAADFQTPSLTFGGATTEKHGRNEPWRLKG